MKVLFVLALAAAPMSSPSAHAEDKPPKWSLIISHNGVENDKRIPVSNKRQVLPMDTNNWTCSTVPDPKGDEFKMGILCTFEKQSISMPVICHEKMPKVSTLTVGNDKFFTALALLCEPHRGRTTPAPK